MASALLTCPKEKKGIGSPMKISSRYKIIFCAVFFFALAPATLCAEKMTDNWRVTGYTKYRDAVFADVSRITSPAPGIKAIWIKIAPASKSQYSQMIREYLQQEGKNVRDFKFIEILCEIDCSGQLIRFVKFAYFDNSGRTIHTVAETNLRWLLILQGNIWYNVGKEACAERK